MGLTLQQGPQLGGRWRGAAGSCLHRGSEALPEDTESRLGECKPCSFSFPERKETVSSSAGRRARSADSAARSASCFPSPLGSQDFLSDQQ